MSVTVSKAPKGRIPGAERITVSEITFDDSYAEDGEPLTAKQLGLRIVDAAVCTVIHGSESSELRPAAAFYSGGKLHLIDTATGKEVASTKNMSKVVVQVVAFGR
jgi:hypothetical protein